MSKERLEEIDLNKTYNECGITGDLLSIELKPNDYYDLLEQAERVQELEEERSEWKGKYSILKNKYRALQRKMKNRWRYNRALENESRTNEIVLEEFREQNKRYREALEFYANRDNYKLEHFDPNLNDYMSTVDYDEGQKARQTIGSEQIND